MSGVYGAHIHAGPDSIKNTILVSKNVGSGVGNDFIPAHELGHHEMDLRPGIMQQVQSKTYNLGDHPLVSLGLGAIGAFTPSTRRALALSMGASYLAQSGKLATEAAANRNADRYLQSAGIPYTDEMKRAKRYNQISYAVGPALQGLVYGGLGRIAKNYLDNRQGVPGMRSGLGTEKGFEQIFG